MDKLDGGGELIRGQALKSPNGRFELKMQQDGNVVLYDETRPIWATNTQHDGAERLAMQDDGNFVVYAKKKPVWSSETPGNQGASLKLQDDGNLVVYPQSASSKPLWASNTFTAPPVTAAAPTDATSASVKSMNATPASIPMTKPAAAPGATTPAAKSANRRTYTVAKGDSLWRIAEKFYGRGTDFAKIARANSISDPDHIRPGQQLVIPE
jgi:nucleoid-associated protein YgaU